jgi:2-dehydropantoate 2-reductase
MSRIGPRIVVHGAGSIGCYVGGALRAAGADVCLLVRPRIAAELAEHGLHLADLHGRTTQLPPSQLHLSQDPQVLADAELILLTVKSQASSEAAAQIARHAQPGAVLVSLQNGVRNATELRAWLPQQHVIAGMVPFNVVQQGAGRFFRGTEGELGVAADPLHARWHAVFAAAGLPLIEHPDLQAILWGKLLLNLNNAVNALSGRPLKAQLEQHGYRAVLAGQQREALTAMRAAGIRPAKVAKVGPAWLPYVLDLPDWLFRRVAARMLAIDPLARSSMWEDLQLGRSTEIDSLNGEIVRLGAAHGLPTPMNSRVVELIKAAEAGGKRNYSAQELHELVCSRVRA